MTLDGIKGEFLSQKEIIKIHDNIIDESELNDDKGFIDGTGDLFDSAVSSIFAGFGGYEVYPTIEEKATRLCYNLITSHTFSNANKRTGLMALLITLDINNIKIDYTQDELFSLINGIGMGTVSYEDALDFLFPGLRNEYL